MKLDGIRSVDGWVDGPARRIGRMRIRGGVWDYCGLRARFHGSVQEKRRGVGGERWVGFLAGFMGWSRRGVGFLVTSDRTWKGDLLDSGGKALVANICWQKALASRLTPSDFAAGMAVSGRVEGHSEWVQSHQTCMTVVNPSSMMGRVARTLTSVLVESQCVKV